MMPEVLSQSIQDYARPITRLDWKKGGAFSSYLFYEGLYIIQNSILYHYYVNIEDEVIPVTIYGRAIELRGTRYKRQHFIIQ